MQNDDWKKLPKYFQVGTVIEGAGEYYSSRLTNKERAATLVDQLLKDNEVWLCARAFFASAIPCRYAYIILLRIQSRKRLKGKFDDLQKQRMAMKGGRKAFKHRMDKRTSAHKKWARK